MTSFERMVITLLENMLPFNMLPFNMLPFFKDSEPKVWVVHAIIGDGINTNEAVAKILWASRPQAPLFPSAVFFYKCLMCGYKPCNQLITISCKGGRPKAASLVRHVSGYKLAMGLIMAAFRTLTNHLYFPCSTCTEWSKQKKTGAATEPPRGEGGRLPRIPEGSPRGGDEEL